MVVENLEEMIRSSVEAKNLHYKFINKNIDLDHYVVIDAIRIKQIFTNLLSNAVKYTPEGGMIQFTMECLRQEHDIEYDVFEITDTGIEMSKEFQKNKLCEPYAQENNELTCNYAEPDLGLAITKNLVELMNGHIEVESELGEGSTFRVYLAIQLIDNKKDLST